MSNPCHEDAICDTNPVNGRAICTCPPGFTGGACDQDVDECSIGEWALVPASLLPFWGMGLGVLQQQVQWVKGAPQNPAEDREGLGGWGHNGRGRGQGLDRNRRWSHNGVGPGGPGLDGGSGGSALVLSDQGWLHDEGRVD